MSWSPGRQDIQRLIAAGEIGVVTPDPVVAARLLDDADRQLWSAAAAVGFRDLSGAYQLAYDSLRKSAAALLALQGLRATSRGGHVAIQEVLKGRSSSGAPGAGQAAADRVQNIWDGRCQALVVSTAHVGHGSSHQRACSPE